MSERTGQAEWSQVFLPGNIVVSVVVVLLVVDEVVPGHRVRFGQHMSSNIEFEIVQSVGRRTSSAASARET